jgi:hypothetical protein
MASAMAMRVEWIVVVLLVLPAQLVATALLVAIAPVSAAVLQIKLVWQVRHAGRCELKPQTLFLATLGLQLRNLEDIFP